MLSKQTAYKKHISKHMYFSGALSCADLNLLTNKSLPLATKVPNELVEAGSVKETGFAFSTGGRRPQIHSLTPDLMYIVSVVVDQLVTRLAVVDMQNNLTGSVEKIVLSGRGSGAGKLWPAPVQQASRTLHPPNCRKYGR